MIDSRCSPNERVVTRRVGAPFVRGQTIDPRRATETERRYSLRRVVSRAERRSCMVTRTRWRRNVATGVAVASGGLLVSSLSSLSFTPVVQGSPSRFTTHSPPWRRRAPVPTRKTIHLLIDGGQKDWISRKSTVAEALAEAGVELGP